MVSKCIEVHNVWEWYFLDNLENLNTVQPNLPDESLVPALDDLARPQREGEGTAAGNAGVKLAPIFFQCPLQDIHVNVSKTKKVIQIEFVEASVTVQGKQKCHFRQ